MAAIEKKNIVLGVTGGIAAFKACEIVSLLKKQDIDVDVIMTENAQEFVSPLTFQTLSQNLVHTRMFDKPVRWDIEHIELAKKADIVLIAPASANIIGKLASGIADDTLTTTVMATKSTVIIAPAMNTQMYNNPIVKENIQKLKRLGFLFIEPVEGFLACKDVGKGKMQSPEIIVDFVKHYLFKSNELTGKKIIITAGPTREPLDPVRFITNYSTGKMGFSLAAEAVRRGGDVTLVHGPVTLDEPFGLVKKIAVQCAEEMYSQVIQEMQGADYIIKSAAVADYRPANRSSQKLKKSDGEMLLALERNPDIALEIGKRKKINQVLVGFAAETNDLISNAIGKMKRKNMDFIVANDLTQQGAGFAKDTNIVHIIDKNGKDLQLPLLNKSKTAQLIWDAVIYGIDDCKERENGN